MVALKASMEVPLVERQHMVSREAMGSSRPAAFATAAAAIDVKSPRLCVSVSVLVQSRFLQDRLIFWA